jgi:putative ABC transport system substrate-binding protein
VASALALWLQAAEAQSDRPRTIAMVMAFSQSDPEGQRYAAAFQQRLSELGWTVGKDLNIESRWEATSSDRANAYAAELAKRSPDLIISHATIVTRAIVSHTREIPVVFVNVSDPLGERFVAGFARPGGRVTGFTNLEPTVGGKYLELLKEMAPSLKQAVMIFNPASTPGGGSYFFDPFKAAGNLLSMRTVAGEARSVADLEKATADAARSGDTGLVVVGEPFTNLNRTRILELAAQHRLPAVCPYRFYAENGCLVSYGVGFIDQFQRAASYADRILKGDKPADLAVQSPVRFEMTINLKTAKTLGLSVPPKLLFTADDVIE